MYFTYFPTLKYTLDDGISYQLIQDIFRRVTLTYSAQAKATFSQFYHVKDGETPEIVSFKFYKTTTLHWVILHANEIIDPRFDWPLSQQNLIEFCNNKYGEGHLYDIHHYERVEYEGTDAEMRLISPVADSDYPETISNWEYEDALNEAKRKIKIIIPELIPALITAFQTLIKS